MILHPTEIIGLLGGIVLASCLIPQIYLVFKTKNVESISLIWQALYIIGLSCTNIYGIYNNLIPVYIPGSIELFFLLILTLLKLIYMKKEIIRDTDTDTNTNINTNTIIDINTDSINNDSSFESKLNDKSINVINEFIVNI